MADLNLLNMQKKIKIKFILLLNYY